MSSFFPADCNESGRGSEYTGCQQKTRLGKTCQKWNSQSPHKHEALKDQDHNYCRAADDTKDIWCFTTDPEVRFDYCDYLGRHSPHTETAQVEVPKQTYHLLQIVFPYTL